MNKKLRRNQANRKPAKSSKKGTFVKAFLEELGKGSAKTLMDWLKAMVKMATLHKALRLIVATVEITIILMGNSSSYAQSAISNNLHVDISISVHTEDVIAQSAT